MDALAPPRRTFEAHRDSVARINGISSIDLGMLGSDEQEIEIVGTVVDASGLVLTSNSDRNPFGDQPLDIAPQAGTQATVQAEGTPNCFQLPGGDRVRAELVLKDLHLGVARLRPKVADSPAGVRSFNLMAAADPATVLDRVLNVS
ncbi:MAG: hypothetical protein AB8G96_06380 [Phycisphaerales bacterium]